MVLDFDGDVAAVCVSVADAVAGGEVVLSDVPLIVVVMTPNVLLPSTKLVVVVVPFPPEVALPSSVALTLSALLTSVFSVVVVEGGRKGP